MPSALPLGPPGPMYGPNWRYPGAIWRAICSSVRSGVALLGWGQRHARVKRLLLNAQVATRSCRRGVTPGPDGALDARQDVGFPPEAQLGLGNFGLGRRSAAPSPPPWSRERGDVTDDDDSDLTTGVPGWASARVTAWSDT